jgi:hypothetical protein
MHKLDGREKSRLNLALIQFIDPLTGLFQFVGRLASYAGRFRKFQLCSQAESFLPLLKNFYAHHHQIAFAVFRNIDRLLRFVGKNRNSTVTMMLVELK